MLPLVANLLPGKKLYRERYNKDYLKKKNENNKLYHICTYIIYRIIQKE